MLRARAAHEAVRQRARTRSSTRDTIAYLGEIAPGASDQTVGITNALDLLQVSPTDNALELSQSTPAVLGRPKTFFESVGHLRPHVRAGRAERLATRPRRRSRR